jgi:hypothetical protein
MRVEVNVLESGEIRACREILGNPSYKDTARWFRRTIAQFDGLDQAADPPERAFQLVDESGKWSGFQPLEKSSAAKCMVRVECGTSSTAPLTIVIPLPRDATTRYCCQPPPSAWYS